MENALIVVDVQRDFMAGGSLAVKNAEEIIPKVNQLLEVFKLSIATKDWHDKEHISFAKEGQSPFTEIDGAMKWPVHCVARTWGSEFKTGLHSEKLSAVFHKGTDQLIESYSGFADDSGRDLGMAYYLKGLGVKNVYICGLALDYCVRATAKHALLYGFNVFVIEDATKAVDTNYIFSEPNIKLVQTVDVVAQLKTP